jgi:fatty acid synthase subunit beta
MQANADAQQGEDQSGIGVDIEPVATFAAYADPAKANFLNRNFTAGERAYCNKAADPAASYAGKWAAKEAVLKALSNSNLKSKQLWKGADAALAEIEIQHAANGAPSAVLHGYAKEVMTSLGVSQIKVSISHSADVAIAQALASQ